MLQGQSVLCSEGPYKCLHCLTLPEKSYIKDIMSYGVLLAIWNMKRKKVSCIITCVETRNMSISFACVGDLLFTRIMLTSSWSHYCEDRWRMIHSTQNITVRIDYTVYWLCNISWNVSISLCLYYILLSLFLMCWEHYTKTSFMKTNVTITALILICILCIFHTYDVITLLW